MANITEIFQTRLAEILSSVSGKTLVVFKGFAAPQIRILIAHPNSLLSDVKISESGEMDLDALFNAWLDLAQAIKQADRPLVGFYEELLALKDILPRLPTERILVVENNILTPWTPGVIGQEAALSLFDWLHQEKEPPTELQQLAQTYGDVKIIGNEALLLPITVEDERMETIPFWVSGSANKMADVDAGRIEMGSAEDWVYRLALLRGEAGAAVFLVDERGSSGRQKALVSALSQLEIPYRLEKVNSAGEKKIYDETPFLPLLKEHWGDAAEFRMLRFYKDPDISHEQEEISQGKIIAEIVDQCQLAGEGNRFSNIFITAPTGSGKSILFQLPALYLAQKHSLVTLVVSPLIALMNDQVDQLRNERGIDCVACINSSMTYEERQRASERIQRGEVSLIYLAPELLLTTYLPSFLGGRKVGLFVIDEAHTVTSWGRDFRSDYWFLGDFIKKCKRDGMDFPVLCLTATAVYSGEDDVVNDTIRELGLERTIIHLGNVKRDNIDFDITLHDRDALTEKLETTKLNLTLERIRSFVSSGEKVLTYFPYRRQVDDIYDMMSRPEHVKTRRYHAQIPAPERKMTEASYKSGEAMALVCTKAFGMGVDVGDIKHVLHFAPSGTLADYVQEIGRAARNPNIQGTAHIDFFQGDMRYVRALNGISEMRQYQLTEMLKKIYSIYKAKNRRNLLVASETFEYLFPEKQVENRTKTGLMLLAKDLSNKYSFPVLVVKPKAMLSKNYICIPREIEDQFLEQYGEFVTRQSGNNSRTEQAKNQATGSDLYVYSEGDTFLVDMAGIWERCFPDMAFGMFKKVFFEQEYRKGGQSYHVAPRVRVEIRYADDFSAVAKKVAQITSAMEDIFEKYKRGAVKQFTLRMFESDLEERLGEKVLSREKLALLLDIFTESTDDNAAYTVSRSQTRLLRKRKQAGQEEAVYFVSNTAYARLSSNFSRRVNQCAPNSENVFVRFNPITQNKPLDLMPLLRFMELLGLAGYEIRGGEKAEVFLRINDPGKIRRLLTEGYSNAVLRSIQERHKRNEQMLAAFFREKMETGERWELIEQYFLGNEDYVRERLRLEG